MQVFTVIALGGVGDDGISAEGDDGILGTFVGEEEFCIEAKRENLQ